MKKAVALLLILLISVSICGCGQSSQHNLGDTSGPDSPILNGSGESAGLTDVDKGTLSNGVDSGNGSSGNDQQDNNNVPGSDSLQSSGNDTGNSPSSGSNSMDADTAPEVCSYCQQPGHKADECPAKKADEALCTYCNQAGHKIDACPQKAADEAPCTYCGEKDHKVDDCKKKKADEFDVGYWVQYAKDYAVSVGLTLDPTMTKENSSWDAPIPATYRSKYIADDVQSRMNTYVRYIDWYDTAGVVWVEALPDGPYEWDLMVYYG